MNFNDVFEEYLELYTEGKEKGLDGKACWDGYKLQGTKKKGGKTVDNCVKSDDEEHSEDNEVAKKIGKGALKLAGKAALGAAKLAGKGALKAGKELGHFVTADDFRGKRSDEEVEDCETCGCEENPEYGHFNDTYSNYIDQYEAEDAEYDMGEVFDTISDDIKAGMTMAELIDEHGADYVKEFMEYLAVSKRDRPTAKTNPRPHVNRKVVNNIKNTPGPDPIEDEEGREFFFGYDIENVHPVEEFVKANYKEGEYEVSIGHGDDVMNYLKVNVDLDDERGKKLLDMIEDCDGEGNYDEDDYEEDAEGKIDKDRMKCNKPRRTSGGSKKFVVKACKDGKEKIVRFGDPNMKIKKSNPKRRKSFRARHKCDQKKDKFSAGYWSCKKW